MAAITAALLNHIIYRYLQESGFLHTAFNFGYEAGVNSSPIDGTWVPQAALVTLVQLGLQFKEMEANAENDGDEDFFTLELMDLITKDARQLQQIVKDMKENPNVAAVGGQDLLEGKEGPSSHGKGKEEEDEEEDDVDVLLLALQRQGKAILKKQRSRRLRKKYQ
ncbi:hypothetical protein OROHE_002483 [Orobanche hederae]